MHERPVRHYVPGNTVIAGHPATPARDILAPFIEIEPGEKDHWWWKGDFDSETNAIFKYTPDRGTKSLYYVVRCTILLDRGGLPGGYGVYNDCGYKACINPRHWKLESPSERARRQHSYVVVTDIGAGPPVVTGPPPPPVPRLGVPMAVRKSVFDCAFCGRRRGCSCGKKALAALAAVDDAEAGVQAAAFDRETPRCEVCWALEGTVCNEALHEERGKPIKYSVPEDVAPPVPDHPVVPLSVAVASEGPRCLICAGHDTCDVKIHRVFYRHFLDGRARPPIVQGGPGRGRGRRCRCPVCNELQGEEHDMGRHMYFLLKHSDVLPESLLVY